MDLSRIIQKIPFVPPIFNDEILDKYGEKVALGDVSFPTGGFIFVIGSSRCDIREFNGSLV